MEARARAAPTFTPMELPINVIEKVAT